MPSDDRITQALKGLSEVKETFLSSVAMSAEEVRGMLERERGATENPQLRLAHELGPFAAGRIDLDRLAPVIEGNKRLGEDKRARIVEAFQVLTALKKAGDELFTARVEVDGYLRGGIHQALAKAGTAFGASRSVEWALQGIPSPEGVEDALQGYPPNRWNRAEKGCAPPLVVEVEGQDLKVASLGDLLEGSQKIVLVVNGPAAPAPLVRLITPGVTVIQTDDPLQVLALASMPGPGIAALMPEGCAKFVHVPVAGAGLDQRLKVEFLPDTEPKRPLGGISAFQQTEELRQLASLKASVEPKAVLPTDLGPDLAAMDDAGQLAAWLINQADLASV